MAKFRLLQHCFRLDTVADDDARIVRYYLCVPFHEDTRVASESCLNAFSIEFRVFFGVLLRRGKYRDMDAQP